MLRLVKWYVWESENILCPHRLLLLENAVINYCGGIVVLESQAREAALSLNEREPDIAKLLEEFVVYLHEISRAGQLYIPEWQVSI